MQSEQVEMPSLVNFTAGLIEHVMLTAGTNRIKGGGVPGGYLIAIGEGQSRISIIGDDAADAFNKFLYWIFTKKIEYTKEQLEAASEEFLRMEKEEASVFIQRITEGGMSEFGKKVQEYRLTRGAKIYQAVQELKTSEDPPIRLEEWKEALTKKTGYEDLDAQEILAGFATAQHLPQRQSE